MLATTTKDPLGARFLEQLKYYPCYGGLDLGAVSDLTCFALIWPVRDLVYLYPWYYIPLEGIQERSKRDGVQYTDWLAHGYIEATPGNVTDWHYVTERIKQLAKLFKIRDIGFDQHGARDTVADLIDAGITTTDVSQGILSISSPAKRLQELALSKKLIHTGHPILRWNIDCTTVIEDANQNIKPVKPPLGKSSKRIDGVIATIMAISRYLKAAPTNVTSVYHQRGLLTL
jgi:phage terminase large subunit-like protein